MKYLGTTKLAPLPATCGFPGTPDSYKACQWRLAAILRQWREMANRKIFDVADDLGVTLAAWGHWETTRHMPSVKTLHGVSALTKIPIQCLICPDSGHCPGFKKHTGWNPLVPSDIDLPP
jgi:hypothetical protein